MKSSHAHVLVIALLSLFVCYDTLAQAAEQGGKDAAVKAHITALEQAGGDTPDAVLRKFDKQHFSRHLKKNTSVAERRALLEDVGAAASSARGLMVDVQGEEYHFQLHGPQGVAVIFTVEASSPYAIQTIRLGPLSETPAGATLSWKSVGERFADLETGGLSGVLYLARDEEPVLENAYGQSNREMGWPTKLNTIYGIGSTPISFTLASLFLLAQADKLSLDDRLSKYLSGVPGDKQAMTLRHLISGQSGLPDFHDTDADWDPDLAWIDRATAVNRILAQPLKFKPGDGRAHSHSAYGLAAAVIEIVSNRAYFDFLAAHIFGPAGMTRTGMYGDARGFSLQDFAVGYGPGSVGIPNIPPNWGPTSWLVMGSGGMYSTLGDMLRFYRFVRSPGVLQREFAAHYEGPTLGIGGSDRGFYLFHARNGRGNEVLFLMNGEGRAAEIEALSRGLEALVMSDDDP